MTTNYLTQEQFDLVIDHQIDLESIITRYRKGVTRACLQVWSSQHRDRARIQGFNQMIETACKSPHAFDFVFDEYISEGDNEQILEEYQRYSRLGMNLEDYLLLRNLDDGEIRKFLLWPRSNPDSRFASEIKKDNAFVYYRRRIGYIAYSDFVEKVLWDIKLSHPEMGDLFWLDCITPLLFLLVPLRFLQSKQAFLDNLAVLVVVFSITSSLGLNPQISWKIALASFYIFGQGVMDGIYYYYWAKKVKSVVNCRYISNAWYRVIREDKWGPFQFKFSEVSGKPHLELLRTNLPEKKSYSFSSLNSNMLLFTHAGWRLWFTDYDNFRALEVPEDRNMFLYNFEYFEKKKKLKQIFITFLQLKGFDVVTVKKTKEMTNKQWAQIQTWYIDWFKLWHLTHPNLHYNPRLSDPGSNDLLMSLYTEVTDNPGYYTEVHAKEMVEVIEEVYDEQVEEVEVEEYEQVELPIPYELLMRVDELYTTHPNTIKEIVNSYLHGSIKGGGGKLYKKLKKSRDKFDEISPNWREDKKLTVLKTVKKNVIKKVRREVRKMVEQDLTDPNKPVYKFRAPAGNMKPRVRDISAAVAARSKVREFGEQALPQVDDPVIKKNLTRLFERMKQNRKLSRKNRRNIKTSGLRYRRNIDSDKLLIRDYEKYRKEFISEHIKYKPVDISTLDFHVVNRLRIISFVLEYTWKSKIFLETIESRDNAPDVHNKIKRSMLGLPRDLNMKNLLYNNCRRGLM